MATSLASLRARATSPATLLRAYLAPHKGRVILLLVVLLVGTALTLLNPQILAAFIDAVVGQSQASNLVGLGALFLAIALVNQAFTIVTNYLSADIGMRATNQLRADLTLHCLQLDMSFHHRTTPGVLIERVDGDVTQTNEFLSNFAVLLLKNFLLLVGSLVAVFQIDWRAGAAVTVLLVVTLGALELVRRLAVPSMQQERESSAQLFGLIEERLAGSEDIRANGAVDYTMRRFYERSRLWMHVTAVSHMLAGSTHQVGTALFVVSLAIALASAVWLVNAGAITIGAAYAIYHYIELMRWPIQKIGRQVQDLQQASASIRRIQELLAEQSAILDTGARALPGGALGVSFDRVTFAYPGTNTPERTSVRPPAAINDLSFTLPPGQVLGLLGRTGSGKTTVTRLLFRLYDPHSGVIRVGGTPMNEITLEALRARVGLVTQDVHLFNASVRDNLTLFEPGIDDQRLLDALRDVELWDWYQSLPHGLDTVLPSGGGGMSAGQAQLLAFARVLLKDPGLIILDEASSRLDPITEQRMEHALDRLLQGRTAIIIAHRLATVQRADWIMVLESGSCSEFGKRGLLASNTESHFAQLLQVGLEEALA